MAAIGSVCLMVVCMAVLIFVSHRTDSTGEEQTAEAATEQTAETTDGKITKEAGAVLAEEAAATNGTSGSGKKAKLKIIEVIPHDICSVFPYMFEWGSKEGYDENTPIGYDGVRYLASGNSFNYKNLQYILVRNGETRECLENYSNVEFINGDNWQGSTNWWKETDFDTNITNVNGYFEYVGVGNGLYTINLDQLVDLDAKTTESSSDDTYGIRYHVMARERKGSESPKGEWEVSDPQYYWAKDYAQTESYPTSTQISAKTDFNYDLKFTYSNQIDDADDGDETSDAAMTSPYRVFGVSRKSTESTTENRYEYEAVWNVDEKWTSGYSYQKGGNYSASVDGDTTINSKASASDAVASAEAAVEQGYTYVWVLSTNPSKPVQYRGNNNKGYFRLIDISEDKLGDGCYVYKLSFEHKGVSKGNYILNPSAVMTIVNNKSTDSDSYKNLYFEYAGSNKGNYDVVFLYGDDTLSGVTYTAEINRVIDGEGRYALTSTANKNKLYVEATNGRGDYSKTVTKIDAAGIDYKKVTYTTTWGTTTTQDIENGCWNEMNDNTYLAGVSLGCSRWNKWDTDLERGAWVFHTVSSDENNGYTTIEEIKNYAEGKLSSGSRIYVYNQNRKYRMYMRTGVKNTEWFKLLMYLGSDGKGIAADDFAAVTTSSDQTEQIEKILLKYKKEIEEFDRSYEVQIIQKTPSQLTPSDVEEADLLYFSANVGMTGLNPEQWNKIAALSGSKAEPFTGILNREYAQGDDISVDTMMAIYKNCIYEYTATTALLLDSLTFTNYTDLNSNLSKMYLMANLFNNSNGFAHFIPGYEEYNEEYSTINENGSVTVYKQYIQSLGDRYNLGRKYLTGSLKGENIDGVTYDQWDIFYFWIVELVEDENGNYTQAPDYDNGHGKFGWDWSTSNWANYNQLPVDDNVRTWYIESSGAVFQDQSLVENVWKILHNKKSSRNSEPVVVVTNADGDNVSQLSSVSTTYYFYVDDYSTESDFDVIYKVNWIPETVTDPRALTSVVVTRDDGTTLQSQESPAYEQEYTFNAAGDFLDANGLLREDVTSRTYLITATDEKGNSDTATVIFIARETFMLN